MASFYAELHLAGMAFPVLQCTYAFHQETDERGRASAKVRHGPLHLRLDVPLGGDALLDWAATAHKPLAGQVVFYETAPAGVARESIAFAAGQCVAYEEAFESGNGEAGAYTCTLIVTAPVFELLVGGGPAAAAVQAVRASPVAAVAAAAAPVVAKYAAAAIGGRPAAAVPPMVPEYTFDEFKATIWDADKVAPAVIAQLYGHFTAAKSALQAGTTPAPHWAALEALIRATTYPNPKPGPPPVLTLNGGWPPASGGFNKRLVHPAPPDTFDRYQKEVYVGADGLPVLGGTFTSPVPSGGGFDYEARALEGAEKDYDLMYEIEVLKPFPFPGQEAEIMPWHGHAGNGVQTKMLFPPADPVTGDYPWSWKILEEQDYIRIVYKSSPSGKFEILPGNQVHVK